MTTMGDRVLNTSLPKIGEKSLFTKDLEDALLNGGVDFVVHSLKDLPTSLPTGMAIGSVLKREDPRDALVLNEKYRGKTLSTLPEGSVIGTSSLRRSAQLARDYPHLTVCDIRGNLNTRLAKLDAPNSTFSGIILAQAGLVRMGWQNRVDQILEPTEILYAVGQGALAVECRSNDFETLDMLSHLSDINTQCTILAERSFLKTLGGGCSAPVAVCTNLKRKLNNNSDEHKLDIIGAVWSLNGETKLEEKLDCCVTFKNDDDLIENNEVIPYKRTKFNNNNNSNRSSPEIIDDSKIASCSKTNSSGGDFLSANDLDIEAIINIHGDLFKKCPYSKQHQEDKLKRQNSNEENGNNHEIEPESTGDGCPLNIPVGQDFMGKCPYVDIDDKIQNVETCPVTGRRRTISEKNNSGVDKCPFASALANEMNNQFNNETPVTINELSSIDRCPFLSSQNQVNLFEYNEHEKYIKPKIVDDSKSLFCGMYKHKTINCKIFRECENLGIKLAECLIKQGALKVMKIAQDEIHSAINTTK